MHFPFLKTTNRGRGMAIGNDSEWDCHPRLGLSNFNQKAQAQGPFKHVPRH